MLDAFSQNAPEPAFSHIEKMAGMGRPTKVPLQKVAYGNLRAIREAAGLTQTELGRRAGVHNQAISRMELGKNKAWNPDHIRRLAKELKVKPGEIISGSD